MALGGDYAYEAADQYRMAGRLDDALRMNGLAPEREAQRQQRVSILFEQAEYARLVAMKLELNDPASRYRIAYPIMRSATRRGLGRARALEHRLCGRGGCLA